MQHWKLKTLVKTELDALIIASHVRLQKRFNVRQLNVIKPFLKFENLLFSSNSQYVGLDVGSSFQICMDCGKFCVMWKCSMFCYWIWCEKIYPLFMIVFDWMNPIVETIVAPYDKPNVQIKKGKKNVWCWGFNGGVFTCTCYYKIVFISEVIYHTI